jgi:glycosyltransferase involved in cell wall biosynthesis
MKILSYRQFFTSDDGVNNRQPRELLNELARRGHQIIVLSDDYKINADEPLSEYHQFGRGYWHLKRFKTAKNMRASLKNRLKTYGYYSGKALLYGLTLPKPDLIYTSIQPLFAGLDALMLAQIHHVPLVMEIRDLWPDDLVARKVISLKAGLPMYPMATLLYKKSTHIISVTPGIKRELLKKGLSDEKIDVLPVGCDKALFASLPKDIRAKTRQKYGWGDDFVAIYPGTHTEATAIDVVVKAANILKETPNVRFALFGAGQCKAGAMELAKNMGLKNIEFHDPVPKSEVAAIMKSADIGLLNLQKSPIIHIFFENKFMDYMAAGLPVFGSMEGEQADIIKKYNFGKIVPTGDFASLAEVIKNAAAGEYDLKDMGQRIKEYGETRLNMEEMLRLYADRIEQIGRGEKITKAYEPNL